MIFAQLGLLVPILLFAASREERSFEAAAFLFDRSPSIFHPSSHHFLIEATISDQDQYCLQIEDGSIWQISSYDGTRVLNWHTNDSLAITQNNRWFSKYTYRIFNKKEGTSVEADLRPGPFSRGPHSRFITRLNHSQRILLLNDNTYWEISPLDQPILENWAEDDLIIIGISSEASVWETGNDLLLINANKNNAVRAIPKE